MAVGSLHGMKMPLLASSSAQNSALIWKFLYEFLVTRWPPLPLSATNAPSSMRQLASPVLSQSPMVLPSVSVTQPGPVWPTACGASEMAKPAASSAMVVVNARIMMMSSLDTMATPADGAGAALNDRG